MGSGSRSKIQNQTGSNNLKIANISYKQELEFQPEIHNGRILCRPVSLYGVKSWTSIIKKIEIFEMWILWRKLFENIKEEK